jgi:hypothetical protein
MSDDSGRTDMSDVFVALFSNKFFWFFAFAMLIVVTGFANADTVISGAERIIRAFRGGG